MFNAFRHLIRVAPLQTGGAVLAIALAAGGSACNSDEPSQPSDAAAQAEPLATQPLPRSHTARCGDAMVGGSDEGWRRSAKWTGPFGFFGAGIGFAGNYRFSDLVSSEEGVKMPVVVSGSDRVIVTIAKRDRDRALLDYGLGGPPSARMAFEPCDHKEATSWPGALRLESFSRPVAVKIAVEGETEYRRLRVGLLSDEQADQIGLT